MNENLARELVKIHADQEQVVKQDVDSNPFHEARFLYVEARGFLAGLEAERERMRSLVVALNKYGQHEKDSCHSRTRTPVYCECGWRDQDAPHNIVLAAYQTGSDQTKGETLP